MKMKNGAENKIHDIMQSVMATARTETQITVFELETLLRHLRKDMGIKELSQ